MTSEVASIDSVVVGTESEALLDRAGLHQAVPAALQHPAARRQVLPVHRDLTRRGLPAGLLHARAPPPRPRLLRALLERQARARDARAAQPDLPDPLVHRDGAGPAFGLAVPGLPHQPLRGALRRLRLARGVPAGHRSRDRLPRRALRRDRTRAGGADEGGGGRPGVRAGGASSATAWRPCARCSSASGSRAPAVGTLDAIAVALAGSDANAQVLPGPRRGALGPPVVLPRQRGRAPARRGARGVPAAVLRERRGRAGAGRRRAAGLGDRDRGARARGAARASRCAPPNAARSDGSSSWRRATRRFALEEDQLKAAHRRERRAEALDGLRGALSLPVVPMRIECFDISNLAGTHTVASMVVFEAGVPKRSDYRQVPHPHRRRARTTSPRWPRCSAGGWRPGSASRTPRRTSRATTAASPRCRT